MSKIIVPNEHVNQLEKEIHRPMNRTVFLKYAGAAMGASALVLAGCKDDEETVPTATTVELTNDDFGILNYAYALEQLEAAFYTKAVDSFYMNASAAEKALLTEIRDHEKVHRDFFKAALGSKAIPSLEVDFSSIDFTNRASVLGAAKLLEDTGVKAYNGAGKYIKSADYLVVAGKIVSVEARHASAIRDLLAATPFTTKDFAGDDAVDSNGLDGAAKPSVILAAAAGFIKTKITSKLP